MGAAGKIKDYAQHTLFHHVVLIAFFFGITYFALAKGNLFFAIPLMLSLALLEAGQNMLNNLIDLPIDKINKAWRPLPAGRISTRESKIATIICFVISFALAASYLNPMIFAIFIIDFLLVISYSVGPHLHKNAIGTMIFTSHYSVFPVIFAILLSGTMFATAFAVPLIYIFLIIWLCIAVKDYEDVEGDRAYGVRTMPAVLGVNIAKRIHAALFFLPYAILVPFVLTINNIRLLALSLPIAMLMVALLVWASEKKQFKRANKIGHLLSLAGAILTAWWFWLW